MNSLSKCKSEEIIREQYRDNTNNSDNRCVGVTCLLFAYICESKLLVGNVKHSLSVQKEVIYLSLPEICTSL